MADLIDIDIERMQRNPRDRADRDHYNIVGLIDAEIHLCKARFQFAEAAEVLEEGFEEIKFISNPVMRASATQILAENYYETRDEFQRAGYDLG